MGNQGYPDEGKDKRLLPGLGWLQKLTQIHFKTKDEKPDIKKTQIRGGPLCWHWPPYIMWQRPAYDKKLGKFRWRRYSIGWCWRPNEKYYMWEAARKWQDQPEYDYAQLGVK